MIEIMKKNVAVDSDAHVSVMHGHTTIELRNVRNNKRERIESDNIVTKASYIRAQNLGYLNIRSITNQRDWLHAVFGGIMLFDKAIPTADDNIYVHGDTHMIGNGIYTITDSRVHTEMGTYLTAESELTGNSWKQVYEYYTNQANGNINSICLAPWIGTQIGYGNSSARYASGSSYPLNKQFWDEQMYGTWIFADNDGYRYEGVTLHNENLMHPQGRLQNGDTKLLIRKRHVPIRTVGVNEKLFDENDQLELTIDAVSGEYILYDLPSDNKFVYVSSGNNYIPVDSTFKIKVLDLTDYSVTDYELTNTTGVQLSSITGSYNSSTDCGNGSQTLILHDNYIYLGNNGNDKIYKLDLNTSELLATIETPVSISSGNYGRAIPFTPHHFKRGWYAIDFETDTARITNGYNVSIYNPEYDICQDIRQNYSYFPNYSTSSGIKTYCAYHNPFALSTINNLQETAEKTAEQTMKITYTLTWE